MTMLQIRHVPDDVHRRLKARAAMEGMTLSKLALTELRRSLDRPTRRERVQRVAARESAPDVGEESAAAVRAERESQ